MSTAYHGNFAIKQFCREAGSDTRLPISEVDRALEIVNVDYDRYNKIKERRIQEVQSSDVARPEILPGIFEPYAVKAER